MPWARLYGITTSCLNSATLMQQQRFVQRCAPRVGYLTNSIQDDVVVVGRICAEADNSVQSSPSKLTEGSVYLESSRYMGSGDHRVLLRFSPQLVLRGIPERSGGLGIFPGAIVALKGRNGGGNCFVVVEIYSVRISLVGSETL